jgi:hypothetical protein
MTTATVTPTIETFDQKFHTLTDKYKLAKTRDIVDRIVSLGFTLDTFVANKTRKKERQGFQKHRAIFTSPLMKATADGIPQLLLTNSHDGTSCIELRLGFFRMVCANGLVIGTSLVPEIRIRHTGADLDDRLIAAIDNMVQHAAKISDSIDKLKSVILTPAQVTEFQRSALEWRTGGKVDSFSMPAHRKEDQALDLFTVMNVVQENLIRGGAFAQLTKDGKVSNKAVRKLNSIQAQTNLNVQLWNMAEQLAA